MGKRSNELSILRGRRVKALLQQYGWTQKQLAEKLNIQESVLSAKLNARNRTITDDDAKEIAKLFPYVREGYIMGREKHATLADAMIASFHEKDEENELLLSGFTSFAMLNGYSITVPEPLDIEPDDNGNLSIEDEMKLYKYMPVFKLSKDGKNQTLSEAKFFEFINKISDHIAIEIDYLVKNGGTENG